MWFPNKQQWIVILLGLAISSSALFVGAMEPMSLAVLSTLSIVWLLEFIREG